MPAPRRVTMICLEHLVGAGDGAGSEPEVRGMRPDGGEPVAGPELAAAHLLDDLAADLLVRGLG